MFRKWLAGLAGLLLGHTPAQAVAEPVQFPRYSEVRNLDSYATEREYEAAIADADYRMERITYPSDGLMVHAYVYRPTTSAKNLPIVIFNRGSWTWPSFHAELVASANRIARRGYIIVAPMYRGSGGAPGRDEMGGADLADLFNLVPEIARIPHADSSRLYLYGESRGGMMVYQALRDGFPARAAAVVGAFTDLDAMLQDPQWAEAGKAIWPELATDRKAVVDRRSAQHWADKLSKPLLIVHGGDDSLVPAMHALGLASKLTASGKPYELKVVAGGGHRLSERTAERDGWVIDWFDRH